MTVHTRYVIIKEELDWLLVNRLLSTLKNLESLYIQPWSKISVPILNLFGSSGFGTLGTLGYLKERSSENEEDTDAPPPDDHLRQFECSLDRFNPNIDTTGGAFLIKVVKNGMLSDYCFLPALNAAV